MNVKCYYNFAYYEAFISTLREMKPVLILQETFGHQGTIIKGLCDVEDLSPWVSGWGPQIFNRPDTPMLFSLEAVPSIILPHQDVLFFSSQSSFWMQLSPRAALINEPGLWH